MSESKHQQAFIVWANRHVDAKHIYAIPNGGARSKATAGRLKAEGVRRGVLDLHLPASRGVHKSLYIEFKFGDGRLSPEQSEFSSYVISEGHAVAVVWDWLLAVKATEQYLAGTLPPGLNLFKLPKKSA